MRFIPAVFLMATVLTLAQDAWAGHLFCHRCGCHTKCKKICRLVCDTKKVTKTEYSCECEDFCVPGPSHKRGYTCECDEHGHQHRKPIWQPTCAKVHTRKKLVKKEVTQEVPDYKWVVEEYCCICGVFVKVEREAEAGKTDDADGEKRAAPKSDSKAQTPLDQLPLAGNEYMLPLATRLPVDQYSGSFSEVELATLNAAEQSFGQPAPAAANDFELPDPKPAVEEPRRLFPYFLTRHPQPVRAR
ncbi:MAG TPA: hypothetical protein VJ783_16810 [Pirellulales bacterium]|nr:hypothetical protein [Pirellulales bacterium]